MRKHISFFLTVLALSVTGLQASDDNNCPPTPCCPKDDINKTFLMPRPIGVNLAREYTAGWYELIHEEHVDFFGGNFQLTFFYEESTDNDRTGRYFSPRKIDNESICQNQSCPPCPTDNFFTWGLRTVNKTSNDGNNFTQDLNWRCFIHLPAFTQDGDILETDNSEKVAIVGLEMDRKAYGFVLDWHQNLDHILKGLFFKVNIPVAHVEHNIDCCVKGFDPETDLEFDATNLIPGGEPDTSFTGEIASRQIENYLSGKQVFEGKFQERLMCGLIPKNKNICDENCPPFHNSETGVADIDLILGYHVMREDNYRAIVNVGITIPTGNTPNALRLWEPIIGNGDHYAVGAGLAADYRAWGDKHHNIRLLTVLKYRYLFENCQTRKLGFCNVPWGHYRLLGKNEKNKLVPAANILARKVDVTPGSQIDYILQCDYNNGGFTFDLGYNLFYRQEEEVRRNDCRRILEKDTWAFPKKDFNEGRSSTNKFNESFREGDRWLTDDDIDLTAAETPRQLSHKIYGAFSYTFKKFHVPWLFGIGGHYEWGEGNETLDTWGINIKTGASF